MQNFSVARLWVKLWLGLSFAFGCAAAGAGVYSNFLDDGGWRTELSVFECALIHAVPHFGDAVFVTRAGEASRFYLAPEVNRFTEGQVSLIARSPVWMERYRSLDLGAVPVKRALRAVELDSANTERLLAELYRGLELVFSGDAWYGGEPGQAAITPVGFRPLYQHYLECLGGLLAVNFDQIRRTSVHFSTGQFEDLPESELRKLDDIVAYVKMDESVREFYIDGHTDNRGTRADNLQLAQRRAEEVTRYLVSRGVPAQAITTRWHGQRYPVATNETAPGRAQNRRVTIRLERFPAP